jgi:site-specific DNA-cytosine methylase
MLHPRFLETRRQLVGLLMKWGYVVQWQVLNTKEHGFLPQSRPRFYLVALRYLNEAGCGPTFTWPEPVDPLGMGEILEAAADGPGDVQEMAGRMLKVLEAGLRKLGGAGHDPSSSHCVIDLKSSLCWSSAMYECSPCLTASRCRTGGFYLTKFQRSMTVREICRLQGIPDDRFRFWEAGVKQSNFLYAVGNAMTSTTLARVLAHVLRHAGMLQHAALTAAGVKSALVGTLPTPGVTR